MIGTAIKINPLAEECWNTIHTGAYRTTAPVRGGRRNTMGPKKISWEVVVGSSYMYYNTRKRAVTYAMEQRAAGHPVTLNRWEAVGEDTSFRPVDLDALCSAQDPMPVLDEAKGSDHKIAMPPALWAAVSYVFTE